MQPTVTEQTGKRYKKRMLLGCLISCVGVVFMVDGTHKLFGASALAGGVVFYLIARAGAWWNHA
ncbi:hypothetical protein D3C78_704030 [compost metagenome]